MQHSLQAALWDSFSTQTTNGKKSTDKSSTTKWKNFRRDSMHSAHALRHSWKKKLTLTQSEFEVRRDLQNERTNHDLTQQDLDEQRQLNGALRSKLDAERKARLSYQQRINTSLENRFTQEDERYRELIEAQRHSRQTVQKQLSSVQEDISKLNTTTSALATKQNTLLGKVNTTREIQDLTAQKIDALARNQASLYDDLTKTMAEVDSLYAKEFK